VRSPRSRSATRCERARLAIGKVAQCELIKNFAVEMADPLANTGIEGSARPIAHRRSGDDATHDLEEHLRAAARLAGGFAEAWGASEAAALPAL
jgi:hypothetical protein